jgi:hypothetical protein
MKSTDWDIRASTRVQFEVDTPVLDTRSGRFAQGRSRDLSRGGIFVEVAEQPPVGALIEMFVGGVGLGPQVLARVVRVVPGEGFGAEFTEDSTRIRELLDGAEDRSVTTTGDGQWWDKRWR